MESSIKQLSGRKNGSGQRHGVIWTSWNDFITSRLLEGALGALKDHEVKESDITVVRVPGAYELGPMAKKMASSGRFDAVTTLGCVIRGATAHFDYVAGQAARLVAQASYDTSLPVLFGVITVDTIEQAIERAGTKAGNKGYEAASAAVELASLYGQF